jgi:hypothetical protein
MRGAKALDGKRVRLLRGCFRADGTEFRRGDLGTLEKLGVVHCIFRRESDGATIAVGKWKPESFELADRSWT